MIFPTDSVRIVVATKPIDFRKGHDGLAALVMNGLKLNPFTGSVFVFRAKWPDRLKLTFVVKTHKFVWQNDSNER